jgi:hypothetical protein
MLALPATPPPIIIILYCTVQPPTWWSTQQSRWWPGWLWEQFRCHSRWCDCSHNSTDCSGCGCGLLHNILVQVSSPHTSLWTSGIVHLRYRRRRSTASYKQAATSSAKKHPHIPFAYSGKLLKQDDNILYIEMENKSKHASIQWYVAIILLIALDME